VQHGIWSRERDNGPRLRWEGESGGEKGECVAVCFRVWRWVVVHRVDESARETVIGAREGDGRKVYAEQVACAVGGGVEKAR
jgi:hypothetical protein